METSSKKHKRILVLFLFGIGLPSLLLTYLAFRGVQNDRALLEKDRREEHHRIAEMITSSIDRDILQVEQTFLSAIADQLDLSQSALTRSLDNLKDRQPLVEEVFYFQNFEQIQLPTAELLFLPDGSTKPGPTTFQPHSSVRNLRIAQQFEFEQKRYQKALMNYEQAFARVSDRRVKGELLNSIARVQKKSKLLQDAIKTYRTIAQDYDNVLIAGGIPLGLAARLELGSLFLATNDSASAIKTFIELYKDLIHREWTLKRSQYDYFAQLIKKSANDILAKASLTPPLQLYQSTFKMLNSEEKRSRKITEKILTFQESAIRYLQIKVTQNSEISQTSTKRFSLEIGGYTYLVSLISPQTRGSKQHNEIWGLLLDAEYLKNNLLRQVLQRDVSSKGAGWLVRGRDGNTILEAEKKPMGSITVKANFVGNFPPWFVEFYQEEPHLFETFLTSRRGIYFYMFFLIAGILIFGLVFTIRAITHELELAKMKSDFVSTISHEFKSPLTSIRQLAEMLKTKRVSSNERRQRYYDVLLEQSERLSLLIDNILDFSKMEEGRKEFEFEKIDVGELLQETISIIQDRVRHEGFIIQAKLSDPLPSIQADRTTLSQALNNLIDNAIKYSSKVKKVIVHAFKENQYLIIAVQDFGIGIKKEEINKVFERFYRGGDELTRTVKGSGIGLTLVKQIVKAHHGTVHVESEPVNGSTFSIKLPLQLTGDQSKPKN
jgi:signal transduction histidine kinase